MERPLRRRSPGWVRQLELPQLHALALRLRRLFWEGVISDRQDWLLDACLSELAYRSRKATRTVGERPCVCELCLPAASADREAQLTPEPL